MNQLLRIRIETIESSILFQVLDQDERIERGARHLFPTTNHWSIISNEFPDIVGNTIYLRGSDRDQDYRPTLHYTDNPQKAVDTRQEIINALEEYCQTLSNTPITNGPNLYTFYTN